MSNEFTQELKDFLRDANLSNYEINTYITLLRSNNLTARELSVKSNVPTGRIYEILEVLKNKGMIEIQDSRPKIYRAISFNEASHNVISHIKNYQQRKVSFLINQAKQLESKINDLSISLKPESPKLFWSTAYGWRSIFELYIKRFNTLKEKLLMTGFLNENTLKVLPQAKIFYNGILKALNRGIQIKYLWSFEFDERILSDEQKVTNEMLFNKLTKNLKDLFNLSSELEGFELRFIQKRIPTYYDIFDNNRVLIKLQNPLKPWQIFACINVLDPVLANELTEKYENMWLFEAIEEKNEYKVLY
ncbi:MAG: TrmB family transcriptional regulator [Promethearchaeota archaeon]